MLSSKISFLSIVLFSILLSCNSSDDAKKGNIVARVGDSYLYQEDISKLVKSDMSVYDSTLIVDRYINRWARKEIIFQKAELNLSAEEANFNKLIEEYRDGLITSAYRQKLINQYLDTIITNVEVDSFYKKNKFNFVLNNDMVIFKYVKFPSNISEKKNIVKMIKSDKLEDYSTLEALCYQFSTSFRMGDSTWVPINELKETIPVFNTIKNRELLKKGKFIEIQDSLNLYLARIIDVRKKKDVAPLSYVDERIHNIILNKRKLELIKKIENQLMEDAIKNREFETFGN